MGKGNSNGTPGVPRFTEEDFQRILRHVRFGHLKDDQFEYVTAFCTRIGLDPWQNHVYLANKPAESRAEMQVLATIEGLRAKARRESGYWSRIGPFWCGPDRKWHRVWIGKRPPRAARVGIRPKGEHTAHWGIATWDECAVFSTGNRGKPVLNEFWAKRPPHMLAKVGEAFALRSAFPDSVSGLYTVDEIPPTLPPQPHPDDAMQLPQATDDTPDTEEAFRLRIVRMHEMCGDEVRRVIAAYEVKLAHVARTDRMRFRAAVLADLGRPRSQVG